MAENKTKPGKNIYQKLLHIQSQINGLGKDKSAFGYKYVTGDKVLEHIKPLMNDLGLLLKQEVISIENTRQDYKTKNGETSEINSKVMMRFTWVDSETGEKDENLFGANGQNAWDKGVGSALTYGERYFLLKYFHIATDEDDIDNPERKQAEAVQAKKVVAEKAMLVVDEPAVSMEEAFANADTYKDLMQKEVWSDEEREAGLERLKTLTAPEVVKAIAALRKAIDKRTTAAA